MQSTRQHFLSRPLTVFLLACVSCALWGSAAPAIKTGYRLFSIPGDATMTIILFAGMRFTLAGLMVLAFAGVTSRRLPLPKRESRFNVVKMAMCQTVLQYIFYYLGVAHASGVHVSILNGASGLIAIVLTCFVFRQEKMTAAKLAGCLLGFGGILVMNLSGGAGGGVSLNGEGFVLFSSVFGAAAASLSRKYTRTESPVILTGWQFFVGGLIMCAFGLIGGGRLQVPSLPAAGILLYLGFLSAMAYTLWTVLIKYNGVSAVSIYNFMNPLFGLVLSALILGEGEQAFSLNTLAALALVCAGIVMVNRFGNRSHCTKPHK